MLIHPAFALFFTSLIASIIITVSANSWLIAWVGLEINLLSFIPLILSKKNKYTTESALKYFLVQTLASILMISAVCLNQEGISLLIILVSLLLKAGAAPSHQWLPAMVEGLSWPLFALMMTLQKMNPIILIFFLMKTNMMHKTMIIYVVMSALVGSVGGLTHNSLRKILTYSSIAHLSWIMSTLICTSWVWFMYFITYTFVLVSLIFLLSFTQSSTLTHITTMNKSYLFFVIAMSILSLGGLPPFTGFLPKFLTLQQLAFTSQAPILVPLLSGTFISLFFYIRVLLASLILSNSSPSSLTKFSSISAVYLNINVGGLLLPSLAMLFL
uniref:NADH-ubiquinone oxidoreductase chain 2 n=1 Tax=Gammarus lacustris TaxID=52639 RepID=A0A517LS40_9CRUS|nr:NADH dehydrogenase subunit 2 [Gammarus lacustris]QDS78450.1 NADH dehydrogenase subunit 2 [Gammarus lacustris]